MFDKKKTLSTVFTLAILFALPTVAAADDNERLVGTWQCLQDTGDLLLLTFNEGGTLTIGGASGKSENHGVWERAGSATFNSTDLSFLYNEQGEIALKLQVQARITVSGDTFAADVLVTFLDLDGTAIDQFDSSVACSRLQVLPLPGFDDDADSDSDSD